MKFIDRRRLKRLLLEFDKFTLFQVVVSYTIITLFLLVPIASILVKAFVTEQGFSLAYFQHLFSDPEMISPNPKLSFIDVSTSIKFVKIDGRRVLVNYTTVSIGRYGPDFGIILNSIFVASIVVLIDLVLGITAAFIMARYTFPGKTIYRVLLVVPLLATPFVNAYVIGKVLGPGGLLNLIIQRVFGLKNVVIEITGLPAVILVQSLAFFPIVYLNALASFISIDPSLEEQAENLGAHGFKLFRTITLPLAKPGIAAGATLVFIFSLEDLGAPIGISGAFGSGLHQKLMSFYIFDEFKKARSVAMVPPSAYALAVLLLLIAAISFLAIKRYVSLKQYAMLSKGGRWNPRVRRPGPIKLAVIYLYLTLLVLVAAFPQFGVIVLAFTDWATETLPTKFTLEHFASLIQKSDVVQAIRNSLIYSSLAVILILIVGASIAYIVARRRIPGRELLDTLSTIPLAIPGILVGVGYITFFGTFFSHTAFDPFLNPGTLLIFTYTVRRMPFTLRSVFAGLQQTHVNLEEAAMTLGATRVRTFFSIVIPLIAANVIGGLLLSFVYCMNEVSTSLMLGALNPSQGPMTFLMAQLIYGSAAVGTVSITAALGVILMALQITAITISNYVLKQRTAFLGV